MAVREATSNQTYNIGLLPVEDASSTSSPIVIAKDDSLQNNSAQFFNQDALEINRRDLSANLQARKLNDALDGKQSQGVLVSADAARFINKGLDGKDRQVKFTTEELVAFSKMADPREAIWRAALERFGSLPSEKAAAEDYLAEYRNARGGEATINWRGGDENGNPIAADELKTAIRNEIAARRYEAATAAAKQNNTKSPVEPKYATLKGDQKPDFFSSMVIDAPTRQAVFSKWLDKNGSPAAKAKFERDQLESNISLRIEDAQKRLKKEFDAKKPGNLIGDSQVELEYQSALKAEIDKIIEQTQADFRGEGLGAQIGDASETVLRGVVNNHPLYRFLPESVKDEMVKFGVGVEKGVIGIAAGVKGASDFTKDAIEDAVVYGLKNSGVDTSKYEKFIAGQRAERREFWTQMSSVSTKGMSQADRAYIEKIERGLRVTPYDLPNKSATAGQAAPQVALALATGGGSLPTQIAVSAALQGTLAGGETYITSNNRADAVKAATIAGVQGAIAPATAKLPFAADFAASALMTYTTGKLEGLSDDKIFQSIVSQTALSGGFRARDAVKFLRANKETVLKTFETTMGESVGKNLRALVEEQGKPLPAKDGGAVFRTNNRDGNEMRYAQLVKTKSGEVQFREITAETYKAVKGTTREVELSVNQFDAANGKRLTADGKIVTTNAQRLMLNAENAKGRIEREPRFITPTTAEYARQIEVAKGMQRVEQVRNDLGMTSKNARDKNVAIADFRDFNVEVPVARIANSGDFSKPGTASFPQETLFKTTPTGKNQRTNEAEHKILEEFATKYASRAKDVRGTIRIFSELPPCPSCTDIFRQFREMFPNVKLEVVGGDFRPDKIKNGAVEQ